MGTDYIACLRQQFQLEQQTNDKRLWDCSTVDLLKQSENNTRKTQEHLPCDGQTMKRAGNQLLKEQSTISSSTFARGQVNKDTTQKTTPRIRIILNTFLQKVTPTSILDRVGKK